MISWKMIQVMKTIHQRQQRNGVCKAREIDVYVDRSTLYRSLKRLETINAVKSHEAPSNHRIEKTYTLTDFGEKLIEKSEKVNHR